MVDLKPRDSLIEGLDPTTRERSIAETDGRLDDVDTDLIRRATEVDEADAAYLPYLAWQESVDVYDPAWSDAIKRAVIKAAPTVHRYKGTRHAVETALRALQVDAVVTEWWQRAPKGAPYTFSVVAYARARLYDGPLLDARLIRALYATVNAVKPVSRTFDLVVGATFPGVLGAAGVALGTVAVRAALHPVLEARAGQTLGLAPVALATVVARVALHPSLDACTGQTLGLAGVTLGRVSVRAAMLMRSDP